MQTQISLGVYVQKTVVNAIEQLREGSTRKGSSMGTDIDQTGIVHTPALVFLTRVAVFCQSLTCLFYRCSDRSELARNKIQVQ